MRATIVGAGFFGPKLPKNYKNAVRRSGYNAGPKILASRIVDGDCDMVGQSQVNDVIVDRHGTAPLSLVSRAPLNARSLAKRGLNSLLAPVGLKVARLGSPETDDVRDFIPLDETIAAAARAGLSVSDYIDTVLNDIPGATQNTIDEMSRLGVFSSPIKAVVEIGPGSGRYLERTISVCSPARYEIYETSAAWAGYLASTYPLLNQPTDGRSLGSTPDRSVDLVHAHKVFSTIPFLPTCTYWSEMARVASAGGYVAFDIMTESCLDAETVDEWVRSETQHGSYPAAMPRGVAIEFFTRRGFDFIGAFVVPMGPGKTEYLVFRRSDSE